MKYSICTLLFLLMFSSILPAQNIVINEIMYNPDKNDVEWIELYNKGSETIDISGWYVLDQDPQHQPAIIPGDTYLQEADYYTIILDGGPYIPFDADLIRNGLFGLSNSGDAVNLYDSQQHEVDKVIYQDQAPWPQAADGDGFTLELTDVNADNNDPDSWQASLIYGGTPNGENSILIDDPYLQLLYPNGTEYIEKGSTYLIEWGMLNYTGEVSVKLINQDNGYENTLVQGLNNTTTFEWTPSAAIPDGENYYIRISGENPELWDISDRSFSIIPTQEVKSIAITEIMYNPPGPGADSLEYLELYNNENQPVELAGYFFSDGIEFEFPEMNFPPQTHLLLARDASTIEKLTGKSTLQWTDGGLNNGGESIELTDKYNNVVDRVSFEDKFPWDTLADGYGPSLTICEPLADNALPGNWHSSSERFYTLMDGTPLYGTPGERCEASEIADVSHKINAKVYPNPVKDELTIEVERGRYEAIVYTLKGEMVGKTSLRGKKLRLEFSGLEQGFYVVELINGDDKGQRMYYKVEHL